eukprot:UN04830
MRSGNISKKLLHIFARIIVCLVISFCCAVTCWRAMLNPPLLCLSLLSCCKQPFLCDFKGSSNYGLR